MVYYAYDRFSNNDALAHHGIKGQKWGVRRYQNPDGTLTAEGKARYGESGTSDQKSKKFLTDKQKDTLKKAAKVGLAAAGTAAVAYGAYKLGSSNIGREFAASQRVRAGMARDATLLSTHRMEGGELEQRINRLKQEAEFRRLTYEALTSSADPKKQMAIDSGKKIIAAALTGIGSYAGYAILSKKFDRNQAANYMFSNPNKKK